MSGDAQKVAPAGAVLFRADDECSHFIIVHSGVVRVSMTSQAGREIVLYRVEPGQICLQTFVCMTQGRRYSAEAVAETDCEISLIAPRDFDRLIQSDETFRSLVYTAVAERFSDYEHTVQALAFSGLGARLASALINLADQNGHVDATHEQLAVEIGSAREAVSRQLGVFAKQGLVALSRGRVTLLNKHLLVSVSDQSIS